MIEDKDLIPMMKTYRHGMCAICAEQMNKLQDSATIYVSEHSRISINSCSSSISLNDMEIVNLVVLSRTLSQATGF